MKIPILDLKLEYEYMKKDIDKAIQNCLEHQCWILGPEVKELEEKVAQFVGTKYAIGVSSGTDALVLSLRALAIKLKKEEYFDEEDLIITTPFTFVATADAILRSRATSLFVDIDLNTYNIDTKILKKSIEKFKDKVKGIIPVHLYGLPCNMDEIEKIAEEYNLFIVEDCAQSFGAKWKDKLTGSFGNTGCFSFFPSKNLGAFGDGGMVTTNDNEIAEIIKMLLKHGGKDKYNAEHIGYNARLDTLQASILLAKIKYIFEFNERRRKIAEIYNHGLKDIEWLILPKEQEYSYHVYHQYSIRINGKERDNFHKYLKEQGVDTMIYYPIPLHKMKIFQYMKSFGKLENAELASRSILSLPIEPLFRTETILEVIEKIKSFS